MRLLRRQNDGGFVLTDNLIDDIPRYAILSHTWGPDGEEVTFEDMKNGTGKEKLGYRKIEFCATKAALAGISHFWVDTCCIEKSSSAELAESLNSMFYWYTHAARCYVYMADLSFEGKHGEYSQAAWEQAFRNSRWFSRGWTLQELLAPISVEFFSKEGCRLGNKESLKQPIHEITGIPLQALSGTPLSEFDVEERMRWIVGRQTKRVEDRAYCLLGMFGVFMPVIYGEGEHAFYRLEVAIENSLKSMPCSVGPLLDNRLGNVSRMKLGDVDPLEQTLNVQKAESQNSTVHDKYSILSIKELRELLQFEEIDNRLENIKRGLFKTCQWLFQSTQYLTWLDVNKINEHHGFLWIKGKPGCGKSTLTKFALQELSRLKPEALTVSFFFNARGANLERTTVGLYRSLLLQLLKHLSPGQHWSSRSFSRETIKNRLGTDLDILKEVFAETLRSTEIREIIFVIDALDECDEDEIRDMVSLFEELGEAAVSKGNPFWVLFSSRYYPHITIRRCIKINLDEHIGHSQDIDQYLSSKLNAGLDPQAEQIRQEVRDRSSGIFMWVVLVVPMLNKAFDHGQEHALREKLQDIPVDLHELFRDMLVRDHQNLDAMKLCIQWLLFSVRPLSLEELYFAILSELKPNQSLVWDQNKISRHSMRLFILSCSKGLAEVTSSPKRHVQFIHETVRDFLLKNNEFGRLWPDMQANPLGLSANRLKNCCLKYLKSDVFDLMDREYSGKSLDPNYNRSPLLDLKVPFLTYAVSQVFTHANDAQAKEVDQLSFLQDFPIRNWIKLNNFVETYFEKIYWDDVDLLYIITERNYLHLVELSARSIPRPYKSHGWRGNPIFASIARNNHEAFEALVKYDSQLHPDGCDFPYPVDDYSALVTYGYYRLVHRFLSIYNIDFSIKLPRYDSWLAWAIMRDQLDSFELLLEKGADPNTQHPSHGSVLQYAASEGRTRYVATLLDRGADPNKGGGYWGNPLQAAAVNGFGLVVEMLLDHGANIDKEGRYPNALSAALDHGKSTVVDILQWRTRISPFKASSRLGSP
jgi:Ankyrin repeats (3 copies)/NACHT domain/Heterokaryon incompatibility protein (HET)